MRADPVVLACFVGYFLSYIPLIYLSNTSGLPPLAVLPVSTAVSCIAAAGITLLAGWWRSWNQDPGGCRAALRAAPFTAAILSLVPLAYAVAPRNSILATVVVMKIGSVAVTLLRYVGGAAAGIRVKLAAAGCAAAVLCAAAGKYLESQEVALSGYSALVAVLYVASYAGRVRQLSRHHQSVAFFSLEHLVAPFLALAAMWVASWWVPPLSDGFGLWRRWDLWALGGCSQVAGLAGGWILVGKRLSSAGMVVNRSAAILAGTALTLMQGCAWGARTKLELLSAACVPFVLALLPSERRPAQ